jgi:GT2 family glycosyltransferase
VASITTLIINYNTRDHLRACLESVRDAGANDVFVVDNVSSDGSPEMIRAEFPWVTLIEMERNLGYGAAANVGVARSDAEFVLLLNSDTRLQPDALVALRDVIDQHPAAGIAGPRLCNPDGSLQVSIYPYPTPFQMLAQESGAGRLTWLTRVSGGRFPRRWLHDRITLAPWLLGAALVIRRSAFDEVGGFDETFFMYYEEVDLCMRMREHGWQILFAPVTTVTHVGGASTSQHRAAMHARWYSSLKHFYRRHYSRGQLVQLRLIVSSIVLGRLVRDEIQLRLTSNAGERDRLAENVAGWRQILLS